MKNQNNSKPPLNVQAGQRSPGLRPHAARSIEHRHERRKIREQLRRLDWSLDGGSEVFA